MKRYKLIGFINMFEIIPDFVYPVFSLSDCLFLQTGENDHIEGFTVLKAELYSNIIRKEDIKIISSIKDQDIYLTVDSKPLYGFQLRKKKIICDVSSAMLHFLEKYITHDAILINEIEEFKNEIQAINIKKSYGIGRRRNTTAKVCITSGTGKIVINGKDIEKYFGLETLHVIVRHPLMITNTLGRIDVIAKVTDGSFTSQAGAIRQAIVRALINWDKTYSENLYASQYCRPILSHRRNRYVHKSNERISKFNSQ